MCCYQEKYSSVTRRRSSTAVGATASAWLWSVTARQIVLRERMNPTASVESTSVWWTTPTVLTSVWTRPPTSYVTANLATSSWQTEGVARVSLKNAAKSFVWWLRIEVNKALLRKIPWVQTCSIRFFLLAPSQTSIDCNILLKLSCSSNIKTFCEIF